MWNMVVHLWILLLMPLGCHLLEDKEFRECNFEYLEIPHSKPRCDAYGRLSDDDVDTVVNRSVMCSDRCLCRPSHGFLYVTDECSMQHAIQTMTHEGIILQYWSEPTLILKKFNFVRKITFLVFDFQHPIPPIAHHDTGRFYMSYKVKNSYDHISYHTRLDDIQVKFPKTAPYKLSSENLANLSHYVEIESHDFFHPTNYRKYEIDCVSTDRTNNCSDMIGDIIFTEKDKIIPLNWNITKLHGCITLLNSPISCDDVTEFANNIKEQNTCKTGNSMIYVTGDDRMVNCSEEVGFSFFNYSQETIDHMTEQAYISHQLPHYPDTSQQHSDATTSYTESYEPFTSGPDDSDNSTSGPEDSDNSTSASDHSNTPTSGAAGSVGSTSGSEHSDASTSSSKSSDSSTSGPDVSDASTSGAADSTFRTSGPEGSDAPISTSEAPNTSTSGPVGSYAPTSGSEGSRGSTSGLYGSDASTSGTEAHIFSTSGSDGSDAPTSGFADNTAPTSGPEGSDAPTSGSENLTASTSGPGGSDASTSVSEDSDASTAGPEDYDTPPSGQENPYAFTSGPEDSHAHSSGPDDASFSGGDGSDVSTSGSEASMATLNIDICLSVVLYLMLVCV